MIPDFSPEIKLCESEAALIKKIHRRKKTEFEILCKCLWQLMAKCTEPLRCNTGVVTSTHACHVVFVFLLMS